MIPLYLGGTHCVLYNFSAHTSRNQYKMLENVPYLSVYMLSWTKTSVTLQNCNSSTNLSHSFQVHASQLPKNTFLGIKKRHFGRLSPKDYSLSTRINSEMPRATHHSNWSYCLDLQRVVSLDREGTVSPSPEKGWQGGGGGGGGIVVQSLSLVGFFATQGLQHVRLP